MYRYHFSEHFSTSEAHWTIEQVFVLMSKSLVGIMVVITYKWKNFRDFRQNVYYNPLTNYILNCIMQNNNTHSVSLYPFLGKHVILLVKSGRKRPLNPEVSDYEKNKKSA